MKKITAETTYRIMDAIAYAVTIMCASEKPTDSEVDELSRAITTLYCHEEGIEPDYTGIGSPVDLDEDEDDEEDDEDEENPLVKAMQNPFIKAMCEILNTCDYFTE